MFENRAMTSAQLLNLGTFEETLNNIPFALTISDLALPDHPLVYMNAAFQQMTGASDQHLGLNCRFLQGDFDNVEARAEIREALAERRGTQVVLKNRRIDGTPFNNLLLLEHIKPLADAPDLAVGTQFELTEEEVAGVKDHEPLSPNTIAAHTTTLRLRLERRRIASDSVVRLLSSWSVLRQLRAGS